jgi:hypothetical protein
MSARHVSLPDHLDLIAAAPEGIRKLRGLILELAVRGKLVPQDPNDEPASELLKRIAKERARLEAEGVCKKPKATPLWARMSINIQFLRVGNTFAYKNSAQPLLMEPTRRLNTRIAGAHFCQRKTSNHSGLCLISIAMFLKLITIGM